MKEKTSEEFDCLICQAMENAESEGCRLGLQELEAAFIVARGVTPHNGDASDLFRDTN